MKIIVTGSTGNISKPLTSLLVGAGHAVSVITSSSERTAEIESLGAKALVGSVEDADFVKEAFNLSPDCWHFRNTEWLPHLYFEAH
jgi:uncharacterized protein YbjT (DUF2867 family)